MSQPLRADAADAAADDDGAFRRLYDRHVDAVTRHVARILGPGPEREDVVREVFAQLYGPAGDDPDPTELYRLTRDVALAHLRQAPRTVDLDAWRPLRRDREGWEELDPRDLLRILHAALEQVSTEHREAFLLHEVEGLSLREIAALTGESVHTAVVRVRRTRHKLQLILEQNVPRAAAPEGERCAELRRMACDWRAGRLSDDEVAWAAAHLDGCPACSDHLRRLGDMLDAAAAPPAFDPDALFDRIVADSTPTPRSLPLAVTSARDDGYDDEAQIPLRLLWPWAVAALAAVVFVALLAPYLQRAPRPDAQPSRWHVPAAAPADVAANVAPSPADEPARQRTAPRDPWPEADARPLAADLRAQADAALAARRYLEASGFLERLLVELPAARPEAASARLDLARIYRDHLRRPQRAAAHLERFLLDHPDDPATPAARRQYCRLAPDDGLCQTP